MTKVCVWMALSLGLLACHEEPPIVVRFEPADAAPVAPKVDASVSSVDASVVAVDAKVAPVVRASATNAAPECTRDADCVIVPAGCCDCANGGKQRAVAKTRADKLRAAQRAACKQTMCTMMISTDPTCGQRARCVDARCELKAATALQLPVRRPPGSAE